MPRKYISPLIWLAAGVLMCIFLIRLGEFNSMHLSQVILFYSSLYTAVAGMLVHTILYRKENLSSTNFGFKLLAEGILFLLLVTYMIGDLFFA